MAFQTPSAGYKFNTFQEIKSHSSILYNERMAILFYLLDMKSIDLNKDFTVTDIAEVRALVKQIYKNVRTLIRNNPTMRATLNLDTKDGGIYVTDVAISIIDKMVEFCEVNGYTTKKIYIITQELNNFEVLLKDVLQYYHYFIRPDFRQKPDIEIATQQYKAIADERTIEELRQIVGKRNRVDFENLGSKRIEFEKFYEKTNPEIVMIDYDGDDESFDSKIDGEGVIEDYNEE
jgi:hypothetical protein